MYFIMGFVYVHILKEMWRSFQYTSRKFKGVSLRIVIVFGAHNGNVNLHRPRWTVNVNFELLCI